MKPYYEQDGITIYHGDWRSVFPGLRGFITAIVTDPPYGIGTWNHTGGNSLSAEECAAINRWDSVPASELGLDVLMHLRVPTVIWGYNYLADVLGKTRAPLIWDKGNRGMHFADAELAWTNFTWGTARIFTLPPRERGRSHPTQKPVSLMSWSIQATKTTGYIADPFMGSGSTLVAAKQLGRNAIGIELEEKYCEIAVERLRQSTLYFPPPPKAETQQEPLL